MAPNTIRARVSFSFKGETHQLDSVIDLDRLTNEAGAAPNFHRLLAQAAGIDTYSYLYEVLESHEIEFTDATGVAAQCCHDGCFDWAQFEREASDERDWQQVRPIVERALAGRDLAADAELKAALLATYRAGMARGRRQ